MKKKALIAMSGGVDSSVAALLAIEQGYEVAGITLRLCRNADRSGEKDAAAVAEKLGIPFYILDFQDDFENEVVENFVTSYEQGQTPNPCVYCNRQIKFKKVLEKADELGYEYIITGHYATVRQDGATGRYVLGKAKDDKKDQSYMLYSLPQQVLARSYFPLGELTKPEVRAVAERYGLEVASKSDSQDICFIPDGDYAGFIESFRGKTYPPGNFVGVNGEIYGTHKGIIHYTIGQRKGLGLSFPQPMFVGEIDPKKNEVVLCKSEELFKTTLYGENVNLVSVESLDKPARVYAKIRYHHKAQPATAVVEDGKLTVVFDEPQRAITKGQSVVLYDGADVVGGGIISE